MRCAARSPGTPGARRSLVLSGRILVADDDPDVLESVADTLERAGTSVVRVTDGCDLLAEMADGGPFDAIVTDIAMPWMNGLQATHSARYAGLATPIVVMTALQDASIPDSVRALGRNAVLLRKPFTARQLRSALEYVLSVRRDTPDLPR